MKTKWRITIFLRKNNNIVTLVRRVRAPTAEEALGRALAYTGKDTATRMAYWQAEPCGRQ